MVSQPGQPSSLALGLSSLWSRAGVKSAGRGKWSKTWLTRRREASKVSSATNHILTCHLPDPTRTPLRSSTLPACFKRAAASVGVGFSQRPSAVAVVTVSLKFSSMARWRRRRPVRLPSNPPTPRPPFTATPPATPPCSQPFTRLDTSRLHHRSSRRAKEHGAPESRRAASLV